MENIRAHPITVFYLLLRYIFVYLIPAAGLIISPDSWKQIAWWNLTLFFATLTVALLQWYKIRVNLYTNHIIVKSGILKSSEKIIPFSKITSIDLDTQLLSKLTGAKSIRIETNARRRKKASLSLRLNKSDADKITDTILGGKARETISQYQVKHRRLSLMAISGSNAAAGFLFAFSVFSTGGRLLGHKFQENLLYTLEGAALFASKVLPPFASFAGVLFFIGWAVSFIRSFSRHYSLTALRKKDYLVVTSGLITYRETILFVKSINSIELRQTLFLRILKQYSAYLQCAGYGKQKGERAILIPAADHQKCLEILHELLPEFEVVPLQFIPQKKAGLQFAVKPLSYIALIIIFSAVLIIRFTPYSSVILLFSAALLLLALWQLSLSLISFRTSGAGVIDNTLSLSYNSAFSLHNLHIPIDKVRQIEITGSKGNPLCNLTVFVESDKKTSHKVSGLTLKEAKKLKLRLRNSRVS